MIGFKKKKDSLLKSFEKFISSSVADTKTITGGSYGTFIVYTTTGRFIQRVYDNGTVTYQNVLGRYWTAANGAE